MNPTDYFKFQAKHLLKDFQTRVFDEEKNLYQYNPKYFDIEGIFNYFKLPHQSKDFKFTLMNAQHTISKLAGLSQWEDLLKANEQEYADAQKTLNSSKYKLVSSETPISEIIQENQKLLPAPQNLYACIIPKGVFGIDVEFTFDSVEYTTKYMIYYSDTNDIATAKPLAEGTYSPIKYTYRDNRQPAKYYWVRAFDGKNYGEWSEIAKRNR
ncbi:MAG: hypothetical protein IKZ86_08810 [Spirochaetaceae bacterium]|nr:hypothetical protein [Spirochaetaceae bacterium]